MSDRKRLIAERDTAQAEVERLRATLVEAKARIQTPTDDVAIVEMDTDEADARAAVEDADLARVTAQRDAAKFEVARLKVEVEMLALTVDGCKHQLNQIRPEAHRLRAEVDWLRANGQGMLDSSRLTDEDIWREAFMVLLQNYSTEIAGGEADLALAEYLERRPR